MAKRRDWITRAATRSARNYFKADGKTPTRGELQRTERAFGGRLDNREGINRFRGRRGVRARARLERINARMNNGTYRQPGGGLMTNS